MKQSLFLKKCSKFCYVLFAVCGCLACTQNQKIEWPQVTNETKPWTRWWWEGNAVYPCRETTLCFKRRKMFKGFQERILGQLFRILLILHDAYNQDKYLLTVFIQEVFVERSFSF